MNQKFNAKLKKGKLEILDKRRFSEVLTSLQGNKEEVEIEVVIGKKKNKRSVNQNNYYWLCLGIIADEVGEEVDNLHNTFKARLLKKHITVNGKEFTVIQSTTKLSTLEFGKYMDNIIRIAAEYGIKLPDPYSIDY